MTSEYKLLERPFGDRFVSDLTALAREVLGAVDDLDIAWRLISMPDATVQVACVDTNLIAFKLGYAIGRTRYHSWLGGVAAPHRAQGVARRLLERQHAWACARGYTAIETGTTKDNRAMLRLNLSAGFEVIGTYARDSIPRVMLQKRLGTE